MASTGIIAFKMTDKELESAINQYKTDLNDGKFERASWPHFCAFLGYTEDEVREVVDRATDCSSVYWKRAVMLRRMSTWVRGQLLSGPGWSGQNQSRAVFALQQPMADGSRYANFRSSTDGNAAPSMVVSFGGGDDRARKARK